MEAETGGEKEKKKQRQRPEIWRCSIDSFEGRERDHKARSVNVP